MPDFARRAAAPAFIDYHSDRRPWRAILPAIYRYLPSEFVSQFFDTGELMLSSIGQFQKHKDEARGDLDEGKAILCLEGPTQKMHALTSAGDQSYILSTSLRLDRETMEKFDGCDAAFEIFDFPNFALEVSRQIVGFRNGISGHCIYKGYGITRRISRDPLSDIQKDGGASFEQIQNLLGETAGAEHLFLKHSRFAYQEEYRLIWNTDWEVHSNIIVKVPDARQFCRKLEPEEI